MIPSENPALFCKAALLPSLHHGPGAPHMPAPGHRSHLGRLAERPNPHRNLLFIEPIDELSNDVFTFQSDLPSTTTHAQPRQVQNPFLNLLNTSSDSIICVASAVRRTILSATELVLSNLQYQWFSSQNYAHLAQGVATMYWSTKKASLAGSTGSPTGSTSSYTLCDAELPQATVAAFIQEPWVLSPHDFNTFCSLRELRNYVPKFTPNTPNMPHDAPWGQAQQLWAFIHDRCEERQCHFFLVTSYEQWAFGCFSQGWTRAFITPPYSYDDAQPTIMERTLHWVLSATLQSEHKSNKYVAPRDLSWMNSLYVAPEIIGEHSWAVAKPGKRRLAEEDDLPASSIINPSPSPAPRLKATFLPQPIRTVDTRMSDSIDAPEHHFPPTARPSALVAGVNAWRQRIPPRNKARNKRRSGDATPDMDIFPSEPVPHASLFRPPRRAFTPSRHTAISINSPERLRLPPLLQSPARQGSVRSEHSGDTALDRTDGISMQVVVADTQLPRDITSLSISDSQSYAVPVEGAQSRPSVSVYRERSPHLPVAPSPRGVTPTARVTRSSVPRRTTRLISKRLREAHLAGTLSTLTEDSGRFSRT